METNFNLDSFVQENGEEINETLNIISKEEIQNKLNNKFIYEDTETPIPGEQISDKIDNTLNNINEANALDSLITKAAIVKAENEKKKTKKHLTPQERNEVRDQFVDSMLYQEGEAYYQRYHHMMDGKTKRKTKRMIITAFNKGKYDKFILNNMNNNLNE